MGGRPERTILNHLIETCHDAERGFLLAAQETQQPQLRAKFLELADQRRRFADDLLPHAQRLGGARGAEGTAAAAVHRRWMQLKARLVKDPDHAVLSEAERGERFAVARYDEAVHDMLHPDVRDLVEAQDEGVRLAYQELAARLNR